jgi:hypothetical protein
MISFNKWLAINEDITQKPIVSPEIELFEKFNEKFSVADDDYSISIEKGQMTISYTKYLEDDDDGDDTDFILNINYVITLRLKELSKEEIIAYRVGLIDLSEFVEEFNVNMTSELFKGYTRIYNDSFDLEISLIDFLELDTEWVNENTEQAVDDYYYRIRNNHYDVDEEDNEEYF